MAAHQHQHLLCFLPIYKWGSPHSSGAASRERKLGRQVTWNALEETYGAIGTITPQEHYEELAKTLHIMKTAKDRLHETENIFFQVDSRRMRLWGRPPTTEKLLEGGQSGDNFGHLFKGHMRLPEAGSEVSTTHGSLESNYEYSYISPTDTTSKTTTAYIVFCGSRYFILPLTTNPSQRRYYHARQLLNDYPSYYILLPIHYSAVVTAHINFSST